MNLTLKEIALDVDEVFRDPRRESEEWLKERSENGMKQRDIGDYTDDELYSFKDRLKAQRTAGRGPDQAQAGLYKKTMLRKINAELKRRGLPATHLGDGRCYGPGCAMWQRAGAAK